MDPVPSFSHLVMQKSLPTNAQQRPRLIAAPPNSSGHTGVPRLYGLTYKGRSEEGISVVSPNKNGARVCPRDSP